MTKRKDPKDIKKTGRKTGYKKEYASRDYIQGYIDECIECDSKDKKFISLCGYAVYIDTCEKVMYDWANANPMFRKSLDIIKQKSKEMLCNGGLNSTYNSTIAKLMLSSNHGMREGTDVTSGGESITIKLPEKMKDI